MAEKEVWITGVGLLSSLGEGLDAHWEALGAKRVNADELCTDFPSYNYKACITVRSNGTDQYDFVGGDGTRTFTLVKGNPGNL